jgi:hypothetical protein
MYVVEKKTCSLRNIMSDKKICRFKNMFFKKYNMTDKKICRLKNIFFKKHNMTDKKHIYVG